MILTPAEHLKAATQARLAAHHHEVAAELARERGDAIGASEAIAECLTDGPVHVFRSTTPGDDAIATG